MSARQILVLASLPEEAKPLRRALRHRTDVVVAMTGDGVERASRATRNLVASVQPTLVIFAGLAGALDPGAVTGDARLVREVRDGAGAVRHPPAHLLESARRAGLPEAVLVSAPGLACTPEERDRTRRYAGIQGPDAGLVDLESSALAAVADGAGVPWLGVCGVSDGFHDRLPRWLQDARDTHGSVSRVAVVLGALLRPARIAVLAGLARRARFGGRALARSVPAIVAAVAPAAESEQRLTGSRV